MTVTKVVMVAAVGLLCVGCAGVADVLIGSGGSSTAREKVHRGPMTPEMWAEREKEVASDLAAIKGAKVVVAPTKVVGEKLSGTPKAVVTHKFSVEPNTCYYPLFVASSVVASEATGMKMVPATKGDRLKKYQMAVEDGGYRKNRMKPYCADFAGEVLISLSPRLRLRSDEPKMPLEFVLGVAAVKEAAEQTTARLEKDRAAYIKRLSFYDRLFFESKVGPIGVLRGVNFGMSKDEAVAATKSKGVRDGRWSTRSGTTLSYQLERGYVAAIQAFFTRANPREAMERHWGKGVEMFSGNRSMLFWFDAERGMRAGLKLPSKGSSYSLRIEPYTPVGSLASDGAFQGDFSTLLGMSMEDFKAKYSWRVRDFNERRKEAMVYMPPLTNAEYNTPMRVTFADGKVSSFELMYRPKLTSDGGQEVFDALEKAFGKPRVVKKSGKDVSFFKTSSPEVTAWDAAGNSIKVRVSAGKSKLFY